MNNLLKGLIFYCFLLMLMGCKAEIIETKIKTEKLKIAISQKTSKKLRFLEGFLRF